VGGWFYVAGLWGLYFQDGVKDLVREDCVVVAEVVVRSRFFIDVESL
jgi:hypothetical protein